MMSDINETDAMDMNEASTHYRDGHAAGMAVGREQIGEREATIAELQAEVERLTRERDAMRPVVEYAGADARLTGYSLWMENLCEAYDSCRALLESKGNDE